MCSCQWHSPIGAASSASRVPATRPRSGWATKRPYSPATCFGAANTLDPLPTAFPCSDYYGSSAPLRRHRPATGLPRHDGRGRRSGSHTHPRTLQRGRWPAMPLHLAMAAPQSFTVASRPAPQSRRRRTFYNRSARSADALQYLSRRRCSSVGRAAEPELAPLTPARAVVVRAASAGSSIPWRLLGLQDRARTGRIVRVPPLTSSSRSKRSPATPRESGPPLSRNSNSEIASEAIRSASGRDHSYQWPCRWRRWPRRQVRRARVPTCGARSSSPTSSLITPTTSSM